MAISTTSFGDTQHCRTSRKVHLALSHRSGSMVTHSTLWTQNTQGLVMICSALQYKLVHTLSMHVMHSSRAFTLIDTKWREELD